MPTVNRAEYLTVNSVPLATPAWWILNLNEEMGKQPAARGRNRVVPGAAGQIALTLRKDSFVFMFEMVVIGNKDSDGAAVADVRTGLNANLAYLKANLGFATAVAATWTRVAGGNKTATVQPISFDTSPLGHRHCKAVLELWVPSANGFV